MTNEIELGSVDLKRVLSETNFEGMGRLIRGKVRDSYVLDGRRILIATDRLSAFDVVLTTVPYKGQALTELSCHFFENTKDIVPNHVIERLDPGALLVEECEVLPIEVVVRAFLVGSGYREYVRTETVSGVALPSGMREFQRLPEPILTPSTKAERGEHDLPISRAEILSAGIVPEQIWSQVEEIALALFDRGASMAQEQGLLLVDTKYEFGLKGSRVVLVDEIHTLDSSRYWEAGTYEARFRAGEAPEMFDKEFIRRWLMERGYSGEGQAPPFSPDFRLELAQYYVNGVSRLLGRGFLPDRSDPIQRLTSNLASFGEKQSTFR